MSSGSSTRREHPLSSVGVLHNLANLHNQLNESERALPLYAECLAIYQQTDDSSGIALVSLGMGLRDRRSRIWWAKAGPVARANAL